jgi:HEAT repeat protein
MRAFFLLLSLFGQLVVLEAVPYAHESVRRSADPPRQPTETLLINVTGGLLTAEIHGTLLQQALNAIARASGIVILMREQSAERVTVTFKGLPLDDALRRILHTKNFVFFYSEAPRQADGISMTGLKEVHIYTGGPGSGDDTNRRVSQSADRNTISKSQPVTFKGRSLGGGESVEEFAQALREGNRQLRKRSAEKLGRMLSAESLEPLKRALSDDDPSVRESMVKALGMTWNEDAVAPLAATLLSDQEPDVREAAARALGETWSEAAVAALGQALQGDPDRYVREAAAHALGEIGSLDAVSSLKPALRDRDPSVREHAAQALGRTASPQAIEALSELSWHDKDPWVKAGAADSLQKILKAY